MSTSHSKTIKEAVDKILVKLSYEDRSNIAEVPADDLFILHYDLGKFIRNETCLWRDNIPLLLDWQRIKGMDVAMVSEMPTIQTDDASMVIVEALWRRIRDQ